MNPIEKTIASKLVKAILARGYEVSVYEGEDYAIKRSVGYQKIMDALASTGEDTIIIHTVDDTRIGSIYLVWGNGEDLVSDNTDNETINGIVDSLELA